MLEKLGFTEQGTQAEEAGVSPLERYAAEPNALERRATLFLADSAPADREDSGEDDRSATALRPRNDDEVRRIDRIQRRTILLAIASGIVSGALIGGGEVWLRGSVLGGAEAFEWNDLSWWIAFYAAVGIITVVEILFLYWNALSGITRLAVVAGAEMRSRPDDGAAEALNRSALARAALEFPNPRIKVHGIDPYALVPGWRLMLDNLLYKMKVGVTSFVLRILLRRVLARAALRAFVPLLAAPLYAAWNAFITWRIMREARLRALGPFAVDTLLKDMEDVGELGDPAARILLHGVGEMTRQGFDAHPNYVLLIARLAERFEVDDNGIAVDWETEAEGVRDLGEPEKDAVLHVLTVAALLGTRVNRGKKRLLAKAYAEAERRLDENALIGMRKDILDGKRISS